MTVSQTLSELQKAEPGVRQSLRVNDLFQYTRRPAVLRKKKLAVTANVGPFLPLVTGEGRGEREES